LLVLWLRIPTTYFIAFRLTSLMQGLNDPACTRWMQAALLIYDQQFPSLRRCFRPYYSLQINSLGSNDPANLQKRLAALLVHSTQLCALHRNSLPLDAFRLDLNDPAYTQ
jgi:hypothetical protein